MNPVNYKNLLKFNGNINLNFKKISLSDLKLIIEKNDSRLIETIESNLSLLIEEDLNIQLTNAQPGRITLYQDDLYIIVRHIKYTEIVNGEKLKSSIIEYYTLEVMGEVSKK